MKKLVNGVVLTTAIMFLLTLTAPAAMADSFDLTVDHCTGGCGPAGTIFGTVSLTQNGTTVDILVHLNSPYVYAKTGAADQQAFKFNGTGITLADITVNQTVPGQTLIADTGAFNGDGTGPFVFGIMCSTCGNGLSDKFNNDIVVHVANATIADLTGANEDGFSFVADVGNPLNGNTGPVASGPPSTSVPEPSSLMLLGSALTGLGFIRKRFRK